MSTMKKLIPFAEFKQSISATTLDVVKSKKGNMFLQHNGILVARLDNDYKTAEGELFAQYHEAVDEVSGVIEHWVFVCKMKGYEKIDSL